MSSEHLHTGVGFASSGEVECWCCGTVDAPERMVQLGNHPEVRLCLACAHFVHQRAWHIEDLARRGPAAFARNRARGVRDLVIRRGWHRNRVFGGALRWLGRHLP